MKLEISNFRRISKATIDLSRIALIAGVNEAGKTSVAQAAAALLTANAMPIPGIPKTNAGVLVHSGSGGGQATITNETGSCSISWPSAKVKQEGVPPFASPIATGMLNIIDMDDKERAKTLQAYLKATPTKEDLHLALIDLDLGWTVAIGDKVLSCKDGRPVMSTPDDGPYSPVSKMVDQLWELTQKQGWDGTLKQIAEKGAKLKGQWEGITGDNYGPKKAGSWIPAGYEHDLDGTSQDTLERIVTDAKDQLEMAIANTAVDNSKRADLEATADRLAAWKIDLLAAENATVDPAMGHQLTECEGFIKELQGKLSVLVADCDKLPLPEKTGRGIPCPHCKTVLEFSGAELHIQKTISEPEMLERKTAIEEASKKITGLESTILQHKSNSERLKGQIATAENARLAKIASCKQLVAQGEAAAKELENMQPESGTPVTNDTVDEQRTAVKRAETRLAAYKAKTQADTIHNGILTNIELQAKIGPAGVRSDVLSVALADFGMTLERLSAAAGWRLVEIGDNFLPTYGGTVYQLLSESAKFRVRVVLQLALTLLDKSQVVVVDAADILDTRGRNGLFGVLLETGLPALVCMTANSPPMDLAAAQAAFSDAPSAETTAALKLALSAPPDLAKAGIGVSYWADNGVVVAI